MNFMNELEFDFGDLTEVEGEVVKVSRQVGSFVPLIERPCRFATIIEGAINAETAAAFVGGEGEVGAGVDLLDQLSQIGLVGGELGGIIGEAQGRAVVVGIPV